MIDLVAKRYVKALLDGRDENSVTAICKSLKEIASAYADEKFISVISSSEVRSSEKVEFVISLADNADSSVTNLIKLLGDNKRLDIIPSIVTELENQLAIFSNSYTGVVYTNSKLKDEYISSIEEKFSNKFNVQLSLEQNVCDYDGIKVDIDGLGVEISFSKERLKSQMIDHILKAV